MADNKEKITFPFTVGGMLSRLETGELGHIKLKSALNLDRELGNDNNEILGMFWAAAQYRDLVSETIPLEGSEVPAKAVGDVLITIARWQALHERSGAWLERLRA
jgi:hypothetical protein